MAYSITDAINDITGGGAGNITEALANLKDFVSNLEEKVNNLKGIDFHICSSGEIDETTYLPVITTPDSTTIYLVVAAESGDNLFNEFIWVENSWEKVGQVAAFDIPQRIKDDPSPTGGVIEGTNTRATGAAAHAEGNNTAASGAASHAEGATCNATGVNAHVEGAMSSAAGRYSHANGLGVKADGQSQTVIGEYNAAYGSGTSHSNTDYVFIIGNGTSDSARSNAFAIKWDGTFVLANGNEITPAQFASLLALLNT